MPDHFERLLTKYLDGRCTPAEAAELYALLQQSGTHKPLLKALQQEFDAAMHTPATIPAAISDRMETRLLQEISTTPVVRLSPLRRWRWAAAAAAVIVLLAGGYTFYTHTTSPAKYTATNEQTIAPGTNKALLTLANGDVVTLDSAGNQTIQQVNAVVHQHNGQLQYDSQSGSAEIAYNVLTVPRGGQFHIILPDGTKVWMNAASSLRYPTAFIGDKREVELQGQGYFEIAQDAHKPFTVKVNNTMDVQVLGTHFDVMAYADEKNISTTLIEGAVKVTDGHTARTLKPGEQALMDPATGAFTVQPADVQQAIAWKTGFFEFDDANLSLIMRQLSRWYDIDVVDKSPVHKVRFGGRISRNLPLADILHMLEANGAQFSVEGRQVRYGEKN